MTKRLSATLFILGILAVVIFAVVFMTGKQDASSVSALGSDTTSEAEILKPRAVIPAQAEQHSQAAGPEKAPVVKTGNQLATGLKRAASYRAYIFDALRRPQDGGRFYASLAFLKCHRLKYLSYAFPTPSTPGQQAAQDALRNARDRCEGVIDQFGGIDQFSRLALDTRSGNDVLMTKGGAALFGMSEKTPAAAALQSAKATGDANLIGFVLQSRIDGLLEDGTLQKGEDETDSSLWARAAASLSCELTASCTDSELAAISCATAGDCHEDFRLAVRADLSKEQQAVLDRMVTKLRALLG